MWNPFKKTKNKVVKSNKIEKNIVDELVNRLNSEGRISELELELKKLNVNHLDDHEKEAWFHMYGICAFQSNDHVEAEKRFYKGLEYFPNSMILAFSLGQEYIFLNKPEEAFSLFDKCSFPEILSDYILAMSRYAYLFGKYERGIGYINQLLPYFWQLKILDDTFLYMRGIPFFGRVFRHYSCHCILSGNILEIDRVVNKVISDCCDYDVDLLEAELIAYKNNDYSKMIAFLKKRISEVGNNEFSMLFCVFNLKCLEALNSDSYLEGITILDSVDLSNSELPWLSDVIMLAKASLANRFSMNSEKEFKEKFIKNQPILLEPENVIDFGLLQYQEKLKYNFISKYDS